MQEIGALKWVFLWILLKIFHFIYIYFPIEISWDFFSFLKTLVILKPASEIATFFFYVPTAFSNL